MALTAADKKAIAEMMAAAIAAATAVPADEPAAPKATAKRTRAKAAPKAAAAPKAPADGDLHDATLVPLPADDQGRAQYARIVANRYHGAIRVGVAKAYHNTDGELAYYRDARKVAYATTRAECDAIIAALKAARQHLPE